MKRFFQSGIGAAAVWMLCALLMAAAISPWVFVEGKRLAASAEGGHLPAVLEWLGAACGRAKFSRFFDRSLTFSAVVLLPLLVRRIKSLKVSAGTGPVFPLERCGWKPAVVRVAVGCVISGGMLWALGGLVSATGAFEPKPHSPGAAALLSKIIVPAAAAALVEEWLFRGVLLGLWLRVARPATACLGTSLLFASLHFLEPPAGNAVADPGQAFAGFELLGKILLHFADPRFFVTDFATLVAVGLILAWARVRSGSLWFSIGLHAGWILAFKGFNLHYQNVPGHALHPWGVGDSLRSGILPLLMLGLTAAICHFALKRFPATGAAA